MIIALDYGTKRVGVAVTEDTERIAVSTNPILYKIESELLVSLSEVIKKYTPNLIILGIPLGHEDKPTQMSIKVKEFAQTIRDEFNLEIIFWNEVMTSRAASQFVKNDKSGKLDSESARIILQEYLDFRNSK